MRSRGSAPVQLFFELWMSNVSRPLVNGWRKVTISGVAEHSKQNHGSGSWIRTLLNDLFNCSDHGILYLRRRTGYLANSQPYVRKACINLIRHGRHWAEPAELLCGRIVRERR